MAAQWYCRLMGSELGPFSSKQLLEMARCHQLMPDDAVKKEVDGAWVAAHRVKGLFDDPAASSIIMASLPPEVQTALESKQPPRAAEGPPSAGAPDSRVIKWYYISDHTKVGPLSFDELAVHSRQGLVKPHSRVWSSKSPKWCEAKDVAGLALGEEAGVQGR